MIEFKAMIRPIKPRAAFGGELGTGSARNRAARGSWPASSPDFVAF
jgi:hypothetical protein